MVSLLLRPALLVERVAAVADDRDAVFPVCLDEAQGGLVETGTELRSMLGCPVFDGRDGHGGFCHGFGVHGYSPVLVELPRTSIYHKVYFVKPRRGGYQHATKR